MADFNTNDVHPEPGSHKLNLRKRPRSSAIKSTIPPITSTPQVQDIYPPQQKNKRALTLFEQFALILVVLLVPLFSLFIYMRANTLITSIKSDSALVYEQFDQAAKRTIIQDYATAADNFSNIRVQLAELKETVWFIQGIDQLVEAADKATGAIEFLLKEVPRLQEIPSAFLALNQDKVDPAEQEKLSQTIASILQNLETIQSSFVDSQKIVRSIPTILLPKEHRDQLAAFETKLIAINDQISKYQDYLPAVKSFLGYDLPHRYLILLQNNNELRPGGGFIGSFIIADTNDGIITSFDTHDVYEFDGQLYTDEPQPPELTGITSQAWIRDSNTSPDFVTNAKKAASLLEKAGGPSVDTIIAVNQSVIEDILAVTGPVNLDQGTITAQNFSPIFTYLIEAASLNSDAPKISLFEFIPKLKAKITGSQDQWGQIVGVISQAVHQKNIMAYSKNPTLQNILADLGLSNQIKAPNTLDELLITHTSIGGNKSDRYLKTRYIHNTEFTARGEIIDHLTIRLYDGYSDAVERQIAAYLRPFGVEQLIDSIRYVLGRGDNVTRLKIYVPFGAKLLSAKGIDIKEVVSKNASDLDERHVLSYVARLAPGATNEVTLSYKLPKELNIKPFDLYQLQLHKAPGINNVIFEKHYQIPSTLTIIKAQPPAALLTDEQQYQVESALKTDQLHQVILRQK
ncbi:hypothetical protein COV81_04000 [Candidatus Peregrinibacteria bacterium CG11_big_fil_rev_8_21_14_0_20_41_10]|nr:MAG: hypothetical protein COV81_04000 [Candidatus Peregrinibacteria bacterium CG11_big_fil_rev_8_21_14_0_20_41_10]